MNVTLRDVAQLAGVDISTVSRTLGKHPRSQSLRSETRARIFEAAQKLQEIPRNANPIRQHNRCKITGRSKGYMRMFGLSRIQFREMASNGLIPGIRKASW